MLQAERETSGPSFTRVCTNLALPVRFVSTKCAWLEDLSLSQHLDGIVGCLSAVVSEEASHGSRSSVNEQTKWNGRATGPYRSPLVYFRSYRYLAEFLFCRLQTPSKTNQSVVLM